MKKLKQLISEYKNLIKMSEIGKKDERNYIFQEHMTYLLESLKVIQSEQERLEEKIDEENKEMKELVHEINKSNEVTDDLFAVMQKNDMNIEKRIEALENNK